MAHLTGRIAPALLASLVAMFAAGAARAETPAASTAPDCLAKPNGPAAKGSHWYYRVQHPSGRHCWYQHAIDAATVKSAPAQPRASAETAAPTPRVVAPAPAPAIPPTSEASSAPGALTADNNASVVPPVETPPIAAPVNAPVGWPPTAAAMPPAPPAVAPTALPTAASAAPPAAAPGDRVHARSVEPAPPSPAPEPKMEALQPQLDAASLKHSPARSPGAVRDGELAEPTTHIPALLGAVSALAIIIIGSFAGRLLTKRPPRGPQRNARARDWHAPVAGMEDDSPGIVPVMPAADLAHEAPAAETETPASPDDWGLRRGRAPRRVTPPDVRPEAPPNRETTRALEDNVRELLHRLQIDLRGQSTETAEPDRPESERPAAPARRRTTPSASAQPHAHVPTEQELDAVLAIWRAKRSG
jgi:hypothetical protein